MLSEQVQVSDPYDDIARLLSGLPVVSIVDGGAYIGSTAIRLAGLFPRATVYAFEPQTSTREQLEANCREHPRIRPVPDALGRCTTTGQLQVGALPYTSSLLQRPTKGKRYYPAGADLIASQPVSVTSLDDWARSNGVQSIDIIKLDLQGYELEALVGARELLQQSVRLIYTEVEFVQLYEHACQFHEVAAYLRQFNFTLYNLYDLHTADDGQLVYADAIFISLPVRSRLEAMRSHMPAHPPGQRQ
jgi:FkbM family methyltransferase